MRLLVGIFSLLAITSTAHATDLSCRLANSIETSSAVIDAFILDNIEGNESQLNSDLPDQNTLEAFAPGNDGSIKASFSNECDNMFSVSLNVLDLQLLSGGYGSVVKGNLSVDESTGLKASTKITCVKK